MEFVKVTDNYDRSLGAALKVDRENIVEVSKYINEKDLGSATVKNVNGSSPEIHAIKPCYGEKLSVIVNIGDWIILTYDPKNEWVSCSNDRFIRFYTLNRKDTTNGNKKSN